MTESYWFDYEDFKEWYDRTMTWLTHKTTSINTGMVYRVILEKMRPYDPNDPYNDTLREIMREIENLERDLIKRRKEVLK